MTIMSTENLNNQEAIEKLQKLVNEIDVGFMTTFPAHQDYPHSVPMSRQEVDDHGHIWYLCSAESDTHQHLLKDPKIMIHFAHVGHYAFLTVEGKAVVSHDRTRIDKYWNKFMEAWFEKGKDDPNIRVIQVIPDDAHYWDNKTNKLVTLLKVASSAVTGQKMDIGREGSLDL
jgi:general stress protein 26